MKLGQIYTARAALGKLIAKDLPFRVSYRLSKLQRNVESELRFIEAERLKIFKRLGEESGGQVQIRDAAKQVQAAREIGDLMNVESTADIRPVEIPIEVAETIELAPADWTALEPFITIQESEEKHEDAKNS